MTVTRFDTSPVARQERLEIARSLLHPHRRWGGHSVMPYDLQGPPAERQAALVILAGHVLRIQRRPRLELIPFAPEACDEDRAA